MKKILSFFFVSVLLAGCSLPFIGASTPKDGDTVSVQYVGTKDDGTEFDSSRKEGRTPLTFTIGQGGMIKGFENAVRDMKVGEIKKVRLEPKDAYGDEFIEKTIPLDQYKEFITQKVPANALMGKLEQKVPKDQATRLFTTLVVGTEKKIGEATLKILAVTGDEVAVSINDPKAAFYGKKLAPGLVATAQDGSEITINSINGEDVEVKIKQKQEVVSKTDKEVTVKSRNPHPLAGQALNFEIELLSIKTPAPVADSTTVTPTAPEAPAPKAMEKKDGEKMMAK